MHLPLTSDFKNCFIDKTYKTMKGFQKCFNSEDIFTIPDFSLMILHVLAPVTLEQIFTFNKKCIKFFCRNDEFDVKTFDSDQLEKLGEYFCDIVNCSFKSRVFPECEKNAYVRPMLKKKTVIQIF